MIRKLLYSLLFTLSIALTAQAQNGLQSPSEFLGYEFGSRFTPHHKIVDYFQHVADNSDLVTLKQIGLSYERRELVLATITSAANQANIEQIRTNNLKLTGLESGAVTGQTKAVVWLSYNVHGNETSASEAAVNTLYKLADPANSRTKAWLDNTVVLIDPMLNPDGRDRYVNWFNQVMGAQANAAVEAREHDEPWPGGRTNHYNFDMNRDWAWQTQVESQARVVEYNRWMPHVHVDFHEQLYNNPYYFAPAAEPFHKSISRWQRDFQTRIGKNHTKYFDQQGWLYFTREVFDLFYPSYGDTWPTFNGSIGMTHEQAGHSMGGLAIVTSDEDTLTLKDRIDHHTTTGLSTIEVTSQNQQKVVDEFKNYFDRSRNNPDYRYKTYLIKGDNNQDKMVELAGYLERQKISFGRAPNNRSFKGTDYVSGKEVSGRMSSKDLLVSVYQPKSVLVNVLFEPKSDLTDSLTYDITAWSLPYVHGLDAIAITSKVEPDGDWTADMSKSVGVSGGGSRPYAYIAEWKSVQDLRYVVELLKQGVRVRFSEIPFSIDGISYDRGTIIITRKGNEHFAPETFESIVHETGQKLGQIITGVSTGFVSSGADFGSAEVKYLKAPRIAIATGESVSQYNYGEIWHYFDQQIGYPITSINASSLGRVDLSEYDVLILPSGGYGEAFGGRTADKIADWVRAGGKIIAVQGAVSFLSSNDAIEGPQRKTNNNDSDDSEESKLRRYADRNREGISDFNAGAIYKVQMDETHPLAFGYGSTYYSLKLDSRAFEFLGNGWNVGVVRNDALTSGFTGYRAKNRLDDTLVFGVQRMGRGNVVYFVDNPLFRGFWENGKLLFANAVFLVGQN